MVTSRTPFPISIDFPLDLKQEIQVCDEQLFRQGIALLEQGSKQNCVATLLKASNKFLEATTLNNNLSEAWCAWARTFISIASITGRHEEIHLAKEKIEKAVSLAGQKMQWEAALVYFNIFEISGEIDDLSKSIDYFEKASKETLQHEFWNDFGKAYFSLSERLQDIRPVIQSISCYKQAIHLSLSNFDGWLGLARSLKKLYTFTGEKDHYTQAYDCFAACCQLKPEYPDVWLERIEFIIDVSRKNEDRSKLRVAIEKCKIAPATPHILACWAEALALLGSWTDRVELIQEAETKIDEALKNCEEDDLFLINHNGKCLAALSEYYCDLDLTYQAIEEFQYSLSLDRTQHACWIWMGKLHAKVYDHTEDLVPLERAIRFYCKALQIKTDPHLYYETAALLTLLGQEKETDEPIDEAIGYFEYLLQNHKSIALDNPDWFFQYGVALSCKDEHHKALEMLVSTLMLSPNYPGIHHQIALVYCNLADAVDDLDYFQRSLHHFKLALRTQEENAQEENEYLLIDWARTWIHLSERATDQAMEENCFKEAEQKLIQAARLGSQLVFYELACLYSLQGSYDLSLTYLHRSHAAKELPDIDVIMDNEWLEGVRLSPQFQEFLALLHKK
jgi:tetratricopeptide (TPR) repeat protein